MHAIIAFKRVKNHVVKARKTKVLKHATIVLMPVIIAFKHARTVYILNNFS